MRLSVDSSDCGNRHYEMLMANNKHVRVFLDDVEQDLVIMCDEERGVVERYRKDESGHMFIDPAFPDRVASEIVYGAVRIEITPAPGQP